MITPKTTAFLEGGCSLIVGTVGADGAPTAGRAWGLTVLSRERGECRLLLDASAAGIRSDLAETGVIAVTAADVPSLHSIQLKGLVTAIEELTDDDRDRAAEFADAFFSDIVTTDGTERALLDRMMPVDFVPCVVRFFEIYDQSPGPEAGASIGADAR